MTRNTARSFAISIALSTLSLSATFIFYQAGNRQASLLVSAFNAGVAIATLVFVWPEKIGKRGNTP